jgi:Glutamyl-tRNAGlu reductase, N-terminal domain
MALADLIVLNCNGESTPEAAPEADLLPRGLAVRTCLRVVRVDVLPVHEHPDPARCLDGGFERYTGASAYRYLLQLACGLESEIPGETEILGQIKDAWRTLEQTQPDDAARLRHWMQRLLQETKEIRSEHVVGLGSATYGSLTRRLLGGAERGTTLLLGAGQLAESVLPYLECEEVLVCNRSEDRARTLVARQRPAANAPRLTVIDASPESELPAWRRAHDVVICIPPDPLRDEARVAALRGRPGGTGRVLHLGLMDATGTPWARVGNLATLRELFALRDTQASQREALLARARKACLSKAQLAQLDDADGSRPGSASHGWEDLAVFQAFGY